MKQRRYIFLLVLSVCCVLFSFSAVNKRQCIHRKIVYAIPDYSEYKKEYATFFDSVAINRFDACICGKMPLSFNKQIKQNGLRSGLIEPLFVNFETCDGIYSQRFYPKISPLYSNGKNPHYLFLIKGKEFIELNNLDSIQIKNILMNSDSFTKIYSKPELDSIYDIIKYGTIWTDVSELAPYYVTNKGKKMYDAFNER